MPDTQAWISAVRRSHDRLTTVLESLSPEQIAGPAYPTEWSVGQVASHLGSQAEIFGLFLDAGVSGAPAPGGEVFGPIWDRWNAMSPTEQVTRSIAANEKFVDRLEAVAAAGLRFELSMFGTDQDLAGLAGMRLGEHAAHTWDIAVVVDPRATIAADAVELLVDTLGRTVARAGQPMAGHAPVAIQTSAPEREFVLTLDPAVTLTDGDETGGDEPGGDESSAAPLKLPAEALIRLVYGRLDPDHTPAEVTDERLGPLRTAFPGF